MLHLQFKKKISALLHAKMCFKKITFNFLLDLFKFIVELRQRRSAQLLSK